MLDKRLGRELTEKEKEYIYESRWYEKDTPICPYCGCPTQTVYYGLKGEIESWSCPICGQAWKKA
jgi:tRNA(Ile2) C34 agmatinyltransferase TiaS